MELRLEKSLAINSSLCVESNNWEHVQAEDMQDYVILRQLKAKFQYAS